MVPWDDLSFNKVSLKYKVGERLSIIIPVDKILSSFFNPEESMIMPSGKCNFSSPITSNVINN